MESIPSFYTRTPQPYPWSNWNASFKDLRTEIPLWAFPLSPSTRKQTRDILRLGSLDAKYSPSFIRTSLEPADLTRTWLAAGNRGSCTFKICKRYHILWKFFSRVLTMTERCLLLSSELAMRSKQSSAIRIRPGRSTTEKGCWSRTWPTSRKTFGFLANQPVKKFILDNIYQAPCCKQLQFQT